MTDLFLHDWRGWTPHREAGVDSRLDTTEKPPGRAIPAMLRRRLNLIGRAVSDMLLVIDPEADHVVLHASRHGDGDRTLEMLYGLNEGDPLSPARFGLSVHNAIVGVYSIASGNRRSQQAVAASGAEWAALMAEARGYLADGERDLLIVFGDQPVPERFAAYAPVTPAAAVALRLSARPASGARQLIETPWPRDEKAGSQRDATLQPLDVIDWLVAPQTALNCPMARRRWTLTAPTPDTTHPRSRTRSDDKDSRFDEQ